MRRKSIEVYVAAFVARCGIIRRPGRPLIDEPGVRGLLPGSDEPHTRLLVTDDRAYDVLAALLPDARAGMINVCAAAARCTELVDADSAWTSTTSTAMICRDLQIMPAAALPGELTLRPVRRLSEDAPGGVPLEEAVAAAMLAQPALDGPPDAFADYLRSLPPAMRLFAAVDGEGAVRATSGSGAFGAFGAFATVILVDTVPGWRGRGIGRAMTAAALRAAQDCGARQACLDSSDAGLSIYRRLGFEAATRTTRFFRRT